MLDDDTPPANEQDDESWQLGDPPEEGREGDEQDSGFEQRGGQASGHAGRAGMASVGAA